MLRLAASGEGGEAVDLEQAVHRHDAAARGGRHELVARRDAVAEQIVLVGVAEQHVDLAARRLLEEVGGVGAAVVLRRSGQGGVRF